MEKFEHFRHILLIEFNGRAKAAEAARNICAVYGTMPSERTRQENGFLVLRRIVLTLVTLHVQEDDHLNTFIHNDPCQCTRELVNVMNCGRPTISTLAFNGQGYNQRVAICASLLAHRLAHEHH